MISIAASAPLPLCTMSYHFRPVGFARIFGSPLNRSGKNPMLSEWSATTRKSSGRESFTGCFDDAVISCPLAKRYASRGPSRQPNAPASIEKPVCRCVSPKNGRVGKLRPAYGEYGGFFEKASRPTPCRACRRPWSCRPAAARTRGAISRRARRQSEPNRRGVYPSREPPLPGGAHVRRWSTGMQAERAPRTRASRGSSVLDSPRARRYSPPPMTTRRSGAALLFVDRSLPGRDHSSLGGWVGSADPTPNGNTPAHEAALIAGKSAQSSAGALPSREFPERLTPFLNPDPPFPSMPLSRGAMPPDPATGRDRGDGREAKVSVYDLPEGRIVVKEWRPRARLLKWYSAWILALHATLRLARGAAGRAAVPRAGRLLEVPLRARRGQAHSQGSRHGDPAQGPRQPRDRDRRSPC